MSIKAFVFDCGGVVLRDGDLTPYRAWAARLGLTEAELRQRLWAGESWALAERGEISEEDFWFHVAPSLGLQDQDTIRRLAEDIWSTWRVDQDVLALIDELRQTHRVAMLSNATDVLEAKLHHVYGVADRFEPILNSARLGLAKPDQRVYATLCTELALDPREIVFVDDRAGNIVSAAAQGLHVAWFVGAAELRRQVASLCHPTASE
ncbi:MAG: HAD family phosphatase [Anaerolineales bacterium]